MRPTAKLSGVVTLGMTLCASWTQAASNPAFPSLFAASALVGQAAEANPRTQSDELLRRARQAIKEGKYDAADALISQAEDLKVSYDPVFSRFSDTPAKLRKELDAARSGKGSDRLVPGLLGENSRKPAPRDPFSDVSREAAPAAEAVENAADKIDQVRQGAVQTIDRTLDRTSERASDYAARSANRLANAANRVAGASERAASRVSDDAGLAVKEVQRLMAQAQAAKERGDLQTAQRLLNAAKSYGVPDQAFAQGEVRPWQLGMELDSEMARRGTVAQANAEQESDPREGRGSRFGVSQGLYNPENDRSRNVPAGAQEPTLTDSVDETGAVSRGQALYEQGIQALQQQDRESALRYFNEAWKFQRELEPGTVRQLREKLALLSEPVQAAATPRGEPSALESIASRQQVLRQKLLSEIGGERDAARKMASTDPRGALTRLQRLRERVTQSDVDPAGRKQLLTMVDREINELQFYIERNRAEIENAERNRAVLADVEQSRRVNQEMQDKYSELVENFNQLMDEERYAEASVLARQATQLDPDNPISETLIWKSRFASRLAEQKRIDDAKENGFHVEINENLHRAAIPFDSDNPIAFDFKNWDDVSRRGIKFRDRNRKRFSPSEIEIQRSLAQMVDANFDNIPLKEVVDLLGRQAGINIFLDPSELAIEGVTSDTPISLNLTKPISLRSVLNLILGPKRLGYVINNDVLKITSSQTKNSDVYTLVYDVADLVIPIPNFVPGYNTGLPGAIQEAHRSMGYGGMLQAGAGMPMQLAGGGNSAVNPTVLAQTGGGGPAGAMPGMGARPAQQIGTGPGGLGGGSQPDFDTLISLVTSSISPTSWNENGGAGTIEPSPANLSIVVSQTQEVHDQIADLLEQLRKLQDLQVTIEVRFITLRDNFFERIGVDFDFQIDDNTGLRTASPTGLPDDAGPSIAFGLTPTGIPTVDLDIPFANGTRGDFGGTIPQFGGFDANTAANFGVAILSDIEVFLLIQAANGDSRSNILQAPKVTMFNGQTASVFDSAQRPFVVGIIPVVGDFAVAHQPVVVVLNEGTSLSVQAVVSPDRRFVRMTLVPFFSKIGNVETFTFTGKTTTKSGTNVKDPVDNITRKDDIEETTEGTTIQLPVFAFTTVTTTVSVPDGGTVLLGGIKRLKEGRDERGIPILSKVPYINRLFKNVAIGREAQSLMMMVTPRIIIQEEEENKLGLNPAPPP